MRSLLLASAILAASFASATQNFRGGLGGDPSEGVTELIFVSDSHLSQNPGDDWDAILANVPSSVLPRTATGSTLSPVIQHALHNSPSSSEKRGLAERRNTISVSSEGELFVSKSLVQHKHDSWNIADIVVGLEGISQSRVSMECREVFGQGPVSVFHVSIVAKPGAVSSSDLFTERSALVDAHTTIASNFQHLPENSKNPSFYELLNSALPGVVTVGTSIFFDNIPHVAGSMCPDKGSFTVVDGSVFNPSTGSLNLKIRESASFADSFLSGNIRFASDPNFNPADRTSDPWWSSSVPGLSPHKDFPSLALSEALSACSTSGNDDKGCDFATSFPAGNLNYPAKVIQMFAGVACNNCYSTLALSLAGNVKFCTNFVGGVANYIGTLQCSTKSTITDCQDSVSGNGCTIYSAMTFVTNGAFETEVDVLAGGVPANTVNSVTYPWSQVTLPAIPIPGLELINGKITPGFVLGSQVEVSGASTVGLNATIGWNSHISSGTKGLQAGFTFTAYVYSITNIANPLMWKKSFVPQQSLTATPSFSAPYIYGLGAVDMTAKFSLVPTIQLNFTMGYAISSTSFTGISPFTISPSIYMQLTSGALNAPAPNGVTACTSYLDSWYAIMYGSDMAIKWDGFQFIYNLPGGSSGNAQVVAPQAAQVASLVPATLFPAVGVKTSGCVSTTWTKPEPAKSGAPAAITTGVIATMLCVVAAVKLML